MLDELAKAKGCILFRRGGVTGSPAMQAAPGCDHSQASQQHASVGTSLADPDHSQGCAGLEAVSGAELTRRLIADLKISLGERVVLQTLHEDAIDLFNVCSDLKRVCYTLWSPDFRLPREGKEVRVFLSFRPMLCRRNERSVPDIVKRMKHNNPVRSRAP